MFEWYTSFFPERWSFSESSGGWFSVTKQELNCFGFLTDVNSKENMIRHTAVYDRVFWALVNDSTLFLISLISHFQVISAPQWLSLFSDYPVFDCTETRFVLPFEASKKHSLTAWKAVYNFAFYDLKMEFLNVVSKEWFPVVWKQ